MKDYNSKPIPFKSEIEAREYARESLPYYLLMIIHSPHANNKQGDYFIDSPFSMVRNFETEVYHGVGKKA